MTESLINQSINQKLGLVIRLYAYTTANMLSCVAVCVGHVIAVLRDRLFVVYDCIRIHVLYACKVERMS